MQEAETPEMFLEVSGYDDKGSKISVLPVFSTSGPKPSLLSKLRGLSG